MTLSPLAQRIYQILVRQLRDPRPLISYGDLVKRLGPLDPPYADLIPNDRRLFDALDEISRACQNHEPPLPILTSIVVRRAEDGSLGTPGVGYYSQAFPQVRGEEAKQHAWEKEVERVRSCSYPEQLTPGAKSRPREPREPVTESVPAPVKTPVRWFQEPTVIAAVIGLAGTLLTIIATVGIPSRCEEPPQPHQVDRSIEKQVPQVLARDDRSSPRPDPVESRPDLAEKKAPQTLTLDEILDVLGRHRQRATFGAVAGLLGREPQSLFVGYQRRSRTSWVVSKTTGLPTGTSEADYPPGLLQNERVIVTPEELREWLREHR